MCFVLNLDHAVLVLSNANPAAVKAVAVVMISLAISVIAYVACAVPVFAIKVSVFMANAVCAIQSCLTAASAARDGGHKGPRHPMST